MSAGWVRGALVVAVMLVGSRTQARDVLAVVERWGAFRDSAVPRCFAISQPLGQASARAQWRPFAAIGYWPRADVRGQLNIRLSHELAPGTQATASLGDRRFALAGAGVDVWAKDRRDDAAIVAAIRSGGTMSVQGHSRTGGIFTDRYELRGAATAIDAAALGCARLK